jgi:hypothetical protein
MKTRPKQLSRIYLVALTGILLLAISFIPNTNFYWVASAQDPASPASSPTPDEQLEKLKRETAISTEKATQADNAKKIAEAQKAELEARFPKPSTSPLAGTTTVEGAVIESQIVSYVALKKVAADMIDAICKAAKCSKAYTNASHASNSDDCPPRLAIYNERDVNLILSYMVARDQIKILDDEYARLMNLTTEEKPDFPKPAPCKTSSESDKQLLQPPPSEEKTAKSTHMMSIANPLSPITIPSSFLGAFVDMTALLRTNVEIKGQTFVIDEAPLAAEVFRAARERTTLTELYYPYVFPPKVNSRTSSLLLGQLEQIHNHRVDAEKRLDDIVKTSTELSETNDAVKKLTKSIDTAIPTQTKTAVLASGNIIKANCRPLSAEVDFIRTLPAREQAKAMVKLIDRAQKTCRRMDPDKVEQLLGLNDVLEQLQKDMVKATDDLNTAKQDQKDLSEKLAQQVLKLDLGTIADPTDPDEVKEQAEKTAARLTALNKQFDDLVAALIAGENGATNTLTNYIRVERLLSVLGEKDYWLQLKVINAGGNNRTKTNLLVDIFRGGNRLSHSGGLIAEYHLFNASGQSISSGVLSQYTKYVDANKIPALSDLMSQPYPVPPRP